MQSPTVANLNTGGWRGPRRRSRLAAFVVIGTAAALTTIGAAGTAQACGGLFCNGRPPDPFAPLPVAQNGENVVFAITKDPAGGATTLTAHIQILYTGDAAQFSWVVPVDSEPTLGVGTDRLFSTLTSLTQPQFQANTVVDGQCLPGPYERQNAVPGSVSSDAGIVVICAGCGGGPVDVRFQGTVGPYAAAVIKSDDPDALKQWLSTNGYVVSDDAARLIDDYVREQKYFVALKLLNGKDVKAIQPIVLTFKATEPCVPLKLTAIAANPDMQVRLWVFGDRRVVPKTFFEMKINEARIDWMNGGANYSDLVKQAADEAGGNAFVTEYAGTPTFLKGVLWSEAMFDLAALRTAMTPPAYVQLLVQTGLSNDSQTMALLAKYIPMPDAVKAMGVTDSQFYNNISTYWLQYTFPHFDLLALTDQLAAVVIEPRRLAQGLMDAHPYLTRMNTFISPEEMTKDPLFFVNRDLPDVSLLHSATFHYMCGDHLFMACNAPVRLELSDGTTAWVRAGSMTQGCGARSVDMGMLKTLPAAESVWQREEVGEGARVVDNRALILAGLTRNNASFPAEGNMFPTPGATTGDPVGQPKGGASGGCGCGVGGPWAGGVGFLGALAMAAAALAASRRRRSRVADDRDVHGVPPPPMGR